MSARIAVLVVICGCQGGDGPGPSADAGPPDSGVDELEIAEPLPPAAPAAPVVPCPDGWRSQADDACDPWPASGPETCGLDEAHFPGETSCARIGPPCPAGDWAEGLPDDSSVVFVKPEAGVGGDGSREAPYDTIMRAVARARDGDVIALAKGTYHEALQIDREVTLWGACVAETILAPPSPHTNPTVALLDRASGLRNLSIAGSDRPGLAVLSSARAVEIEAVAIRDVNLYGLAVVTGGQVHATDVLVRGVRSGDPYAASALRVEDGSQAEITRASFEASATTGVRVLGTGSSLVLSDVAIRDTFSDLLSSPGSAIELSEGGRIELQRAALDHNEACGIDIRHESTLVAQDLVVAGTRANAADPQEGGGLRAREGAQVEIARASFTDNESYGIGATGAGTLVDLSDTFVRGTIEREDDDRGGFGIVVIDGAELVVTRGVVEQNHEAGLATSDAGTRFEGTDLVVRATEPPRGLAALGFGVESADGSVIELERALVESSHTLGVNVQGEGAVLRATDLRVRDTLPEQDTLEHGVGLQILQAGRAELERAAFEGNRNIAIAVFDGALEGRSLTVEDTRSSAVDGTRGFALQASQGAQVSLEQSRFSRNRDATFLIGGDTTRVDLVDAVVEDTLQRECVVDDCADTGGGTGIAVVLGGALEVRRFRLARHALCGLQIATEAAVDLHEGVVSDNLIGVNLQVDGYDVSRLEDDVRYLDNERTLDASRLPLPDPEDVDF